MTEPVIASVAVESPIPQLDRLFDYLVPEPLQESIAPGVRVTVPFGRSGKLLPGFVVTVSNSTTFDSKLNAIETVVSTVQVLPTSLYQLARAVADRQAGILYEVLRLAVPKRSVRVEQAWQQRDQSSSKPLELDLQFDGRLSTYSGVRAVLAEPRAKMLQATTESVTSSHLVPAWVAHFVTAAVEQVTQNKSAILIVPDFRDQNALLTAIAELGLSELVAIFAGSQTPSVRYSAYLQAIGPNPTIVVGSRSAAYAPVANLGLIAIWDDGDQSLQEPVAPYVHTREVCLIRQQQSGCNLLLSAHVRTSEVQRLVEMRYVTDSTPAFSAPRIICTTTSARIDATAYNMAKRAFESGGAVLFQVANTGHTLSLYCQNCSARSQCSSCHGPLYSDSTNALRCRWCSAMSVSHRCHDCGAMQLRPGSAGSTRTAIELGKSFPGVPVTESTSQKLVTSVGAGKRLVVATPGCEPVVAGGYALVVLLDCNRLLGKDTLKSTEAALQSWSNATAMLASGGTCVAVGMPDSLAKPFAAWSQIELAQRELQTRRELGFPPALRMASVTGPRKLLDDLLVGSDPTDDSPERLPIVDKLGPVAIDAENVRYLLRYEYSAGAALAKILKARTLQTTAASTVTSAKTGRVSRSVRVKMDDAEVI